MTSTTILRNSTSNLEQHSTTRTLYRIESPAMQHHSQGQVRRDLIQVRPPSWSDKGVRGEYGWKQNQRSEDNSARKQKFLLN